jgi:hypothetical protein
MNGFWWIILHNWTLQERIQLRAYVDAWMAAEHTPTK